MTSVPSSFTSSFSSVAPVTVSINPTGLTAGSSYTGNVFFTANGALVLIPVTINVSAQAPKFTLTPQSLSFAYQQGAATPPAAQNISITSSPSKTAYTVTASTTTGGNWLSVPANAGGTTPGTLAVSVSPGTLSPGTYSGTVTVTPVLGQPVTLPVTLTIFSGLTASPSSLNFNYQLGSSSLPPSQTLAISSTPSGVAFTASASSTGNWLSTGTPSGTTPGSIAVSVNVANLPAGIATGQVTISFAGGASVNVPVTVNVTSGQPAVLSVSPLTETFSLAQASAPVSGQVTVSNTGGGTLQFTAQASGSQSWLTLNTSAGSATPASPASLAFTVNPTGLNPGFYSTNFTVSDSNSKNQAVVSVILTVTNPAQAIQLSQTGLTLTAVAGGTQPQAQSLTVADSGSGTLNWTAQASTLSGGSWLSVSPSSGASIGGQTGTSVSVTANAAGLAAGQYYGSVNIAATGALNTPQTVSVLLNVVASQGVTISTGGVILPGFAGSTTPVSQTVSLFNPSSSAIAYTASANGTSWLSVSPSSGSVSPGANSLQITADLSGLASGVYTGVVSLAFGDGTSANIQVLALAEGGGNKSSAVTAEVAPFRPQILAACPAAKPSFLIPIFRQPVAQSTAQVAAPQTVRVQVIDDCGNPVTAAAGGLVQVTFSSPDAGLDLHDVGAGIWEATWTPVNAAAQVTLQVTASEQGITLNPALAIGNTVTVPVQAAAAGAAGLPTGIANAASAAQATPQVVAPGGYIAIYGTGLAGTGSPSAPSLPLPTTLNGTQLFLGGLPMPLLYAGAGQVNALVPQGIAPNATYPLLIVRGNTQSVPVSLTVTELQPGIYSIDTSGSGPGIVTNALTGQLINASNPAHASDYLTIYCTGLGPVAGPNGEPEPADGAPAPLNIVYQTTASVTATIGGVPATVLFSGLTATFAGLYQVNLQVPAGVAPGNTVPLVLTATDPNTGFAAPSNSIALSIQ